jgi:hypothetical protein
MLPHLDQVQMERVMLEVFKFSVQYHMDMSHAQFQVEPEVFYRNLIDRAGKDMVMRLTAKIAGQQLPDIKYPADWKQAFKERWFPQWLLKKYPVKYKQFEVKALYPYLSIPPHQEHLTFYVAEMPKWTEGK